MTAPARLKINENTPLRSGILQTLHAGAGTKSAWPLIITLLPCDSDVSFASLTCVANETVKLETCFELLLVAAHARLPCSGRMEAPNRVGHGDRGVACRF